MSIAKFAVAESAIGQDAPPVMRNKTRPKRQYVARADIVAVPEPR